MYSNTANGLNKWMIFALVISPIYSMPSEHIQTRALAIAPRGCCELAPEARDSERGACISGTPFCFPQAFDHTTGISMALILPAQSGSGVGSSGFLPPDFIASITTPLPYGFAGMGGADEDKIKARSATTVGGVVSADWWIQAVEGVLPRSHLTRSESESYAPIVQIYAKSSTANALTRVDSPLDAGANITISPRSTQSSTTSHMLFRCQNCPIQILSSSSSSIELATSISPTQPVYQGLPGNSSDATGTPAAESAVLPLTDVKRGFIVVTPFRTGEYETIAKILQLD